MAQHYKHSDITKSRVKVFLGWESFNPKGNVAPGRMDQNLCGRLWTQQTRDSITLTVSSPGPKLDQPTESTLKKLTFLPAKVGEKFGPTFSTHLFRLEISIPTNMDNLPVHLLWDSNSEAMVVSTDGTPLQGLVGGDHWARRADYPLFPHRENSIAKAGETITVYVEVSCNGLFGAGRGGDIEPPEMDRYYELAECCLAVFDPTAWALIHDVTLLSGLAEHLPDTPRKAQALQTANDVINVVDVQDPQTYQAGRKVAARFLTAKNGESQSIVHSMLHSHIDLAWLWPMAATPAKGARTFATHLRLMDMYPDVVYVQSQAQLYAWVKDRFPKLWEKVLHRVKDGRFVPVGSTWVEMDCNIPSGESLIRQFVFGQAFFKDNFGKRCSEFWLPDTFGYAGQLPQIMKGCDVDYFMTIKLSWNLFNKFPHSSFVWEGLDGTSVLAHMPPADTYNSQAFPEEVLRSANKNKDSSVLDTSVMLVGHGDGGGGASPAMIESMKRMNNVDGVPKVEFSTPQRFFEEMEKKQKDLPRWVGELYFELHRGTYTNQARTKQSNRQCENLLRDLEAGATLALILAAATGSSFKYPLEKLEECWKLVLKNCFHDTLPGSCIGEVYEETTADYKFVLKTCTEALDMASKFSGEALATYADSPTRAAKRLKPMHANGSSGTEVLNGTGSSHLPVVLRVNGTGFQLDESSSSTKSCFIIEAKQSSIFESNAILKQKGCIGQMTAIPQLGEETPKDTTLIALHRRPAGIGLVMNPEIVTVTQEQTISKASIEKVMNSGQIEYVLQNKLVTARIAETGRLTSLVLASSSGADREALKKSSESTEPESSGGNRLIINEDVSQFWCAWDTEVYSFEKYTEIGAAVSCEIVEEGPLRVALHVKYPPTKAGSKIEQYITLRAESARVDFRTQVDWKESRKILRVLFNTMVRSPHANYDSQFGFVKRPTTFNHSWEIAKFEAVGHQYCDLSEHNFGVAILNDCKYGYSVRDSTMRLSLLRASKSPDENADQGMHQLTYSILPHWNSFPTRTVLEEAADLNCPPIVCAESYDLAEHVNTLDHTFKIMNDKDGGLETVSISAVKKIDKDDKHIVVRMFEAMGGRGEARLRCPPGINVGRVRPCNMLEDIYQHDMVDLNTKTVELATGVNCTEILIPFTPFQIRSIALQFS